MSTILDYYEYAKLAAAAYVDMDPFAGVFTEAQFTEAANAQERIPIKLAEQMFVADPNSNPYVWTIPTDGYHGNDDSGFAATLFERTDALGVTEKVVAIRGTEPTGSKLDPASQFSLDLMTADLAGIGVLGVAITQLVETVNTLLLWSTPTDRQATQLKLNISDTEPEVPYSMQVAGKDGSPVYFYFTTTQ